MGMTGRSSRAPASPAILDHLAVAAFDDTGRPCSAVGSPMKCSRASSRPRHWKRRSTLVCSRPIIRPGAYRLDRICARPRPRTTMPRCSVWPNSSMPACGRLNALLSDDGEGTAFARLAADPGRVGLESLLAEIAKLDLFRALELPSGPLARLFTPTRPSAFVGVPRSRPPGSCADIPSASACRCWLSVRCRARARSWTAWSSC